MPAFCTPELETTVAAVLVHKDSRHSKTAIGLHTSYSIPQLQYAIAQLATNKHIDLVTLSIGANDLLLLQQDCAVQGPGAPACIGAGLNAVLQTYAENLVGILGGIRSVYSGSLILVKYYSPSPDPLYSGTIGELNDVMAAVGANFQVKLADSFAAFQLASALSHGDPCEAELVARLSPVLCDIHPSQAGTNVIAASVLQIIGKKE